LYLFSPHTGFSTGPSMAGFQPEFREKVKTHACRRIEAFSAGASG
jgi:hypothetical protein